MLIQITERSTNYRKNQIIKNNELCFSISFLSHSFSQLSSSLLLRLRQLVPSLGDVMCRHHDRSPICHDLSHRRHLRIPF